MFLWLKRAFLIIRISWVWHIGLKHCSYNSSPHKPIQRKLLEDNEWKFAVDASLAYLLSLILCLKFLYKIFEFYHFNKSHSNFVSRRFRLRSLNMGRLYTVVDTLCSRFFDALLTSITAKLLSVCFLFLSFNLWWDLFISQNASKNPQQVYFSCHSNILSAFCHWLYCIHVISDIHIIRFSVWFNLSPSFSNGNAI